MESRSPSALAPVQSFARALERKPDDAASTCFYGVALESMGAFDRARERFLLAVHLGGAQGPIASVAFQALSRLTLAEDTAVALAFARKAVTAEPASAAALLQLAKSAAAGGDRDRQLSALRAAAALAESEVRPMYQLMQIYRQMDDEADARLAAAAYKRRVSCFGKEGSETR